MKSLLLPPEKSGFIRHSSNLAPILHAPPSLTLIPEDTSVVALDLIDPSQSVARMIASALRFRPETAGLRAEVAATGHPPHR